jgi:hypothetical protein
MLTKKPDIMSSKGTFNDNKSQNNGKFRPLRDEGKLIMPGPTSDEQTVASNPPQNKFLTGNQASLSQGRLQSNNLITK